MQRHVRTTSGNIKVLRALKPRLQQADGDGHVVLEELCGAELPALVELVLVAPLGVLLGGAVPTEQVVYDVQHPLADFPPRPLLSVLQVLRLPFLPI